RRLREMDRAFDPQFCRRAAQLKVADRQHALSVSQLDGPVVLPHQIGKTHFQFVGAAARFKLAEILERSAATERPGGRDGGLQLAAPKQVHPRIGPEIGVLGRKLDGPIFLGLRFTRDAKKSTGTLNVRLELHPLSFPAGPATAMLAERESDGSWSTTPRSIVRAPAPVRADRVPSSSIRPVT